jgi:hypothetical protein
VAVSAKDLDIFQPQDLTTMMDWDDVVNVSPVHILNQLLIKNGLATFLVPSHKDIFSSGVFLELSGEIISTMSTIIALSFNQERPGMSLWIKESPGTVLTVFGAIMLSLIVHINQAPKTDPWSPFNQPQAQ